MMLEEFAMIFGGRVVAPEDVFASTLEYRTHRIETVHEGEESIAIIYDGDQEIQREYGKDYHQAIARAKAWIDEQDEMPEEYDLHEVPKPV